MEYEYKLTTHGRAVMAACMALEKPFHITGVAFGSGLVSEDTNLADVHELLEYISGGTMTERRHRDERLEFTIRFANVEHPEVPTFMLTEFIVYVEDPTTGEETDLLYGTLGDYRQPVPAYHPAYPPSVFSFPLTLVLSNELQVNVSAPSGIVTYDDLQSMMASGELSAAPSGTGAPTEDTPSIVGGRYFDIATKQEYICIEVTLEGKTVWRPSGSAAPSGAGAPTEDTPSVVGGHYFDTETEREYICVKVTPEGKTVWKRTVFADELLDHNSDPAAHSNQRHVIAARTRDAAMPDYGISGVGKNGAVVLDVGEYTGAAEVSVVVSGAEYDAKNMSASGDAPDGTLILRKTEES